MIAYITPYYCYADDVSTYDWDLVIEMNRVTVTTYAQFGYWCSLYPNFEQHFELIICDEPHNLVNFSEIKSKDEEQIKVHQIARAAICNAVKRGNVLVVGITATPKPLEKLACQLKSIPIDKTNLKHYTEKDTIKYCSINSILSQIPFGKRGGLYVKRVHQMIQYGNILRERGFNPLLLWSLDYKEIELSAAQLIARQYIIENEAVPDEYDIFLFNATAETSINILSPMDFFIAHDTGETHITQSRGRYRGDLETLYVYDPKCGGSIFVPEEYLNKPLFREDLKRLRDFLDIPKDNKGHPLSIPDMMGRIAACGYTCEMKEIKRKQSWIIHKT